MSDIEKQAETKPEHADAEQRIDDLPHKELTEQDAEAVKGGASLPYSTITYEYKPQKPDGSLSP